MYSYLQDGHGIKLHSKIQEAPAYAGLHISANKGNTKAIFQF